MRDLALALTLLTGLLGCSSSAVIEGSSADGGDGGGGSGGSGGATTSASGGGTTSFGGFGGDASGSGAGPIMWENDCPDDTSVSIALDGGQAVTLTESCPGHGAQYDDGPVAFQLNAGFVGSLFFEACDSQSGAELSLRISDDVGDPDPIAYGNYDDGMYPWQVDSGTLQQTGGPGDLGQLIEGTFTLMIAGNHVASGSLRVCHVPDLNAP